MRLVCLASMHSQVLFPTLTCISRFAKACKYTLHVRSVRVAGRALSCDNAAAVPSDMGVSDVNKSEKCSL